MLEAILDEVNRIVRRRSFVGMAVATSTGRDFAFGLESVDPPRFVTDRTLFETGSTGKSVTAALALRHVDDIRRPVVSLLDGIPAHWSRVTVGHLLNHRSGIPDYLDWTHDFDNWTAWKSVRGKHLEFKPGQNYSYSNSNYCLLGCIIERLAGRPYGSLVDEMLGRELGIDRLFVNDMSRREDLRANGYVAHGALRPSVGLLTAACADGPLLGTARGLIQWVSGFWSGAVVDLTRFDPAIELVGRREIYQFGWRLKRSSFGVIAFHAGGTPGFESFMAWNFETRQGFAALANTETIDLSTAFRWALFTAYSPGS